MNEMTVKQLRDLCDELIRNGCGEKRILISQDDEWNGFHGLWGNVVTEAEDVADYQPDFHDGDKAEDVILLG